MIHKSWRVRMMTTTFKSTKKSCWQTMVLYNTLKCWCVLLGDRQIYDPSMEFRIYPFQCNLSLNTKILHCFPLFVHCAIDASFHNDWVGRLPKTGQYSGKLGSWHPIFGSQSLPSGTTFAFMIFYQGSLLKDVSSMAKELWCTLVPFSKKFTLFCIKNFKNWSGKNTSWSFSSPQTSQSAKDT